ncbi:MAG: SIMPL domain-containing protein [Candidatus Pacebacteria bacterium]|nr:SIMPL domain-containing protein [Candidatus Paceibacterota bacterium]
MCKFLNEMENLKKIFWGSLSILIVVCAIWTVWSIRPLEKYAASLTPARTIVVSGEGKVTAIPDIATISFSVVSRGATPAAIASANNTKINAAIEYVKSQGMEDKDIKTTNYDLSPVYEYDKERKTSFISGYSLTQTVTLKIRDFTKISAIVGALPGFGVNDIGSLSFSIDDDETYLNEARKEAFEKAFAKARAMAKQNHVKIERVVTFSESQNYPYYYKTLGMGVAESSMPSAAPRIEPGSQEVTVSVSVTYEIE